MCRNIQITNIVWTWLITCPGIHDTKQNLLKKMLYVLNVQILSYEFESCCRRKIFRVNTFSFLKELLLIFIIFLSLIDRNVKFWIMRGGYISFYLPLQNAQLHKWFWFNHEDLWKPLWSHPGFHASCCVLIRMMMMKMTKKTLIKPPYFSFNTHLWPEEFFFSEKIPEFIALKSFSRLFWVHNVCVYMLLFIPDKGEWKWGEHCWTWEFPWQYSEYGEVVNDHETEAWVVSWIRWGMEHQ